MTTSVYFYCDHDNKRNVIFFRKGALVDLNALGQKIGEDTRNLFRETTFVELGNDVKRVSRDVIYTESYKEDGLLRFYEENRESIYFLRFCSHRNVFLVSEFTKDKEPFSPDVVRINHPRDYSLSIRPVQCTEVKIRESSWMATFHC